MNYRNDLLVVLGNGFDLHLKLQSKLSDFFNEKVFKGKESYNGTNLLYHFLFFRYFAKDTKYDYGSFRRVDDRDPNWMDVEGFFEKIATDEKILSLLDTAYRRAAYGVLPSLSNNSQTVIKALSDAMSGRNLSKSGARSIINELLLDDLLEFEKSFKEYLLEQLNDKPNYNEESLSFLDKIVKSATRKNDDYFYTFIFNFNYTLLQPSHRISSKNVHGSLKDNIIIGYDSSDEQTDNLIYELGKDWQKISVENKAFDLRLIHPQHIVFYGHSLGEQDYPYFFEIFDHCGLLDNDNNTMLYFCYSKFGTEEEQKVFYNRYRIAISKLLNSFENYRQTTSKRNTIITKLKSQNRLHFILVED